MQEYLDVAKAVALEAGGIIRNAFGIGTQHILKEDYSPITETDKRVNDLIIERLRAAFPSHRFLGEEGADGSGSEYVWVFDPIDGTVPYLRGIPTNVCAIALVRDGDPVLGVVYDPYTDRLYHAVKGKGAFLNDAPIHTSDKTELHRTYVETDHHRGFKDFKVFHRLRDEDVRFLSYSSTIYAQMLVACGQIEGIIFPGTRPWDAAAGKIIIEEAGGVTSDIRGASQTYDGDTNGFVASCTPEYHEKLLTLLDGSI